MRRALLAVGWSAVGLTALAVFFVAMVHNYHARRFRGCSDELEVAVRSSKTFEAFTRDPRPDGLMSRYSHQERGELVAHVATRSHTAKAALRRYYGVTLHISVVPGKILRGFAIRGIERWPVARIEVACPCPSNATGLGSHMAHLITFTTARFDISKEPANPINPIAGHGVLTWLREELLRAHYRVSEPDTEDWGWYIYVDGAGASYLVGASGAADDAGAPVEWTIQVHRNRSMKDRVLGRTSWRSTIRCSRSSNAPFAVRAVLSRWRSRAPSDDGVTLPGGE